MVNSISDKKFQIACGLASDGRSIREIAKIAKIAKQTAQDIQQAMRLRSEEEYGNNLPKRTGGYWDQRKHLIL